MKLIGYKAHLQRPSVCCLGAYNNRRVRKVFLNKETFHWGLEGWLRVFQGWAWLGQSLRGDGKGQCEWELCSNLYK